MFFFAGLLLTRIFLESWSGMLQVKKSLYIRIPPKNIKEGKKERKAVLQNKGQTDKFTIIIELPGHSKDYIIHTS